MHILHLAIFPDVLISLLCDLTDDVRSRDAELDILWSNYKVWCDGQAVPDRASRKLFSSAILKPNAREYATISQKLLSATAARYMIFWLGQLMASLLQRYSRSSSKEFYESHCSNFRIPFYVGYNRILCNFEGDVYRKKGCWFKVGVPNQSKDPCCCGYGTRDYGTYHAG